VRLTLCFDQAVVLLLGTLEIEDLGLVAFTRSLRAKYFRITVRLDGSVVVTVPRNGKLAEAKQFLEAKTEWVQAKLLKLEQNREVCHGPDLEIDLVKAQEELFSRLGHFSEKYNLPYSKVAFRCQKSRWGSCSGRNNISLNINIAYLPRELQDYVLLHELCHVRHKNHSKAFWAELDKYVGDAKSLRKRLRNYGLRLI
jgi:hypothetical protein